MSGPSLLRIMYVFDQAGARMCIWPGVMADGEQSMAPHLGFVSARACMCSESLLAPNPGPLYTYVCQGPMHHGPMCV